MVIDVCKEHLPSMADCLTDPRVTIHTADGAEYVRNNPNQFDVIITDAPDPDGVCLVCLTLGVKPNFVVIFCIYLKFNFSKHRSPHTLLLFLLLLLILLLFITIAVKYYFYYYSIHVSTI